MVRLLQRQQMRLATTAMAASSPTAQQPRVRMCISWRRIFVCILVGYTVGLVTIISTIDGVYPSRRGDQTNPIHASSSRRRPIPNYHDPSHLVAPQHDMSPRFVSHLVPRDVSRLAQTVQDKVQQVQDQVEQLGVSELVHKVQEEVEQLQNRLESWTWQGWENAEQAMPYDEVELLSLPVDILRIQKMEEFVQEQHGRDKDLKLCRRLGAATDLTKVSKVTLNTSYFQNKPPPQYTTDILASCHEYDPQKRYYVFNPLEHSRIVCNLKIPAKQLVELPREMWSKSSASLAACLHAAHLYPVIPNITGAGLKPTLILDNVQKGASKENKEQCDVPCLWSGWDSLITRRTIYGTPFEFTFSMEGPEYYPELKLDRKGWKHNKFFATSNFDSDIPLPYFSFAEYDIQHRNKPVEYDKAIKAALFLARNCGSRNNREALVINLQKLSSIFRIDSLSECLQNAKPPKGISLRNKNDVMRHYMFYMSFENQNSKDYITEKLWGAFQAGVIPIYMGTPNIKEHVPDNSIIAVQDFDTPKALAEHLRDVASDRFLYESYHAWRDKPLPDHFMRKYNITKTHNKCRTCRWAYAKRYGLGWSHERQAVLDLKIPRHACRNEHEMLTWPVREHWFQSQNINSTLPASTAKPVLCAPSQTLPWEAHASVLEHWERTIHEHDGVIDLRVQPKGKHATEADDDASEQRPLLLELGLPFDESDDSLIYRRVGPGHVEFQNQTSRVTLLFTPIHRTPIRRPTATTIHLVHPHVIRIIVEDLDLFHQGASEMQNYFGATMKRDWDSSLEVFVGN